MFIHILRVILSEYSYTWRDTGAHQIFSCNGTQYGSDIYTDALGRMTSENISLQSGTLQRSITYTAGSQTEEHIANGKRVKTKEEATRIYKTIKDPVKKAKWRQWMKGKGWRTNHLN